MAENEDQQKKIRELEESLARELDQQVKLGEPTDIRLQGTVELNPTLNLSQPQPGIGTEVTDTEASTAPAPTYEPVPKARPPEASAAFDTAIKAPAPENEISLEDLDSLLSQEMPDLQKELDALRQDGNDPQAQAADLSAFDVDEGAAEVHAQELALPVRVRWTLRFKRFFKNLTDRFLDFLYQLPIKTFRYLVKFFKEDLKSVIAAIFYKIKSFLDRISRFWKGLSWPRRLAALLILLIPIAIGGILFVKLPELQFLSVDLHERFKVDAEVHFNTANKFVPLSEEGTYPEHVILLERIVVNIKPSEESSPNPMVAIRLYFELSTREGAIEVKDREKEMKDLVQRVLETFSYDQMVSPEGKTLFKESLRREMSALLNNGVVKSVFIDDILLKP